MLVGNIINCIIIQSINVKPKAVPNIIPDFLFFISKYAATKFDMPFTINKAIPIYKQVSPIVKNVKDAFNTVNSIKEASKEATIKEVKELERPISNFKKKTTDNRKDSLDTLTFFQ